MPTIVFEDTVRIPAEVADLASFRRWVHSNAYPERGRFAFLAGEVWVDMSPEGLFGHNRVKGEISRVLGNLLVDRPLGYLFHDRTLVTNQDAGLSTEPDGTFVSFDSLRANRARLVEGVEGVTEIEGAPDMVLEVVSRSSVHKDTVVLREMYHRARVLEYWLVDARGDRLRFDLLRRGRSDYVAAKKRDGWAESRLFGVSCRLLRRRDAMDKPQYVLELR